MAIPFWAVTIVLAHATKTWVQNLHTKYTDQLDSRIQENTRLTWSIRDKNGPSMPSGWPQNANVPSVGLQCAADVMLAVASPRERLTWHPVALFGSWNLSKLMAEGPLSQLGKQWESDMLVTTPIAATERQVPCVPRGKHHREGAMLEQI